MLEKNCLINNGKEKKSQKGSKIKSDNLIHH